MNRRQFLTLTAAAIAGSPAIPLLGQVAPPAAAPGLLPAGDPRTQFDRYFLPIIGGFLRNAKATSPDWVVCDFPDGTKLKGCCTPSGKTYVSVARMLPVLTEWHLAGRSPGGIDVAGERVQARDVLLSIYRNAFDPTCVNFWGDAPADKPTQRSVEAAMVAWCLWRLGPKFVEELTPRQRINVQKWLASCTQVPERKTNHAWFTAINQGVRIELAGRFPEFVGDEAWMADDLKALEQLGQTSAGGWYSDAPDQPIFDYYNFWVFGNFPLFWGGISGKRYPAQYDKFRERIKTFMQNAPNFFAGTGAHPLMGRSLIYRWAVLSPMILAYREGLWPYSPGLLRRIVRKSFDYHWSIGAFDAERGKLRETYSRDGSHDICENYVDSGHPYWAMQVFPLIGLPKDDPFWTAPEEPLPVEQADFTIRFDGPRMLLAGNKATGEVRWMQAQNSAKRDGYRDKYIKFVYSSHFPFNVLPDKDRVPPDQALIFHRLDTGQCVGRASNGVTDGKLITDGVETTWSAKLGDWTFTVVSRIRLIGEFEERTHRITAPPEAMNKIELIEGSHALGLASADRHFTDHGDTWQTVSSRDAGFAVASWRLAGHQWSRAEETFGESNRANVNLIYPRVAVSVVGGPLMERDMTFASLHFASPRPPTKSELIRQGDLLAKAWKA